MRQLHLGALGFISGLRVINMTERANSVVVLEADLLSGPVHMIPGPLIAPGKLTDPGVNFASVHGRNGRARL